MLISTIHDKFKTGFDKMDTFSSMELVPEQTDIILNEAQDDVINEIINLGVEEQQTYKDYFAKLVTTQNTNTFLPGFEPFELQVELPSDYMLALMERVDVQYPDCKRITSGNLVAGTSYIVIEGSIVYQGLLNYAKGQSFTAVSGSTKFNGTGEVRELLTKRAEVKAVSRDKYIKVINNPFTTPNKDKILALEYASTVVGGSQRHGLIGSQFATPSRYYLHYYRKPARMQYGSQYAPATVDVDCELSDRACNRIVEKAITKAYKIFNAQEYPVMKQEEIINTIK